MNQFETISQLCADIVRICDQAQKEQAAFLARRGLTMEMARALPRADQVNLQAEWRVSP